MKNVEEEKRRMSTKRLIGIIILAGIIVFAGLIAVGIFLFLQSGYELSDQTTEEEPTPEPTPTPEPQLEWHQIATFSGISIGDYNNPAWYDTDTFTIPSNASKWNVTCSYTNGGKFTIVWLFVYQWGEQKDTQIGSLFDSNLKYNTITKEFTTTGKHFITVDIANCEWTITVEAYF